MKVALSANTTWNLVNFRSGLIQALVLDGHDVIAISPLDKYVKTLEALGCHHVAIKVDNKGTNLIREIRTFYQYFKILRREKPSAFLGYTIKPNIYGSFAAHALCIPTINNVSGLGTAFIKESLLTKIVKRLYALALKRSAKVFFQNADDRRLFCDLKLVQKQQTRLVPGSGINLSHFLSTPRKRKTEAPIFLMIARMLWDKGVGEFVEAARKIRKTHPEVQFQLLGFLDVDNRTAVPRDDMNSWVEEGVIEYLGTTDDVRPSIANASCIVLPSYREGTPRSLLEAAAMAKPLIATDVPGCREVVIDGNNGYLCNVRDNNSLAEACVKFLSLETETQLRMGMASRALAEEKFDEKLVIEAYQKAIAENCSN